MAKDLPYRVRFGAVDKLSGTVTRVANKFPKLTRSVTRSSNAFKILQARTAKVSKSFARVGQGFKSVGTQLTLGLTAPIVGFAIASVRATATFQKSMNSIQAKTSATTSEMKEMETQARLLGSTTSFSASQAADAMAFLGQAGLDVNEILAATPQVLALAAASNTDLARTADIASNIMGAFKIEAKDMGLVADVLAATTAGANVNMEQLAESMKFAAPIANKAGLSIQETAAAVGLLGNVGIQGSQAGTTLKNVLLGLSAPSSKAGKIFKKLKVDVIGADGAIRPLSDVMQDLGTKVNKLPKAKQLAVLKEVFGKISLAGAAEFTSLATTIGTDGVNSIEKFTKAIIKSDGAAKRMEKTMLKGLPGAIVRLKSSFEGLLLKIGLEGGLAGIAEKLLNKLRRLINFIKDMNPSVLKIALAFGAFLAVLGPLAIIIGVLLTMVPSMIAGFIAIQAAIAAGQLALVPFLLLMAKFILIAGAIAFVAFVIMDNWKPIKAFFSDIFTDPIQQLKDMLGFLSQISGISSLFGFGGDGVDQDLNKQGFKIQDDTTDSELRKQGFKIQNNPSPLGEPTGAQQVIKTESIEKKSRETNARVSVDISNLPRGSKTLVSGDTDNLELKTGFAGGLL